MPTHDIENTYHCDCRDPAGHAQWLQMKREIESLRAAGQELVNLKDGPRGEDYERRKGIAWLALRGALGMR